MVLENTIKITQSGQSKACTYYTGNCSGIDLFDLAQAPSFSSTAPDYQIALNVRSVPVTEWQRPLDTKRILKMTTHFNNDSLPIDELPNLMPNPVLLSVNPNATQTLQIQPYTVPTGTQQRPVPGVSNLIISPLSGGVKPFWILDGQHRISALARSTQKDNPIPFVLLYDSNAAMSPYTGSLFAKIFAEVTTQAKPLDKIHGEWLSRAFKLIPYDNDLHCKSIDTVLNLVSDNKLANSNLFFDKIQLNPVREPVPRVLEYDVISLKKIIFKNYYSKTPYPNVVHLTPKELSVEIIEAFYEFSQIVKNGTVSSVFGDALHRMKVVQTGYLVGVLTFLLRHAKRKSTKTGRYKKPITWKGLLKQLGFHTQDWNFRTWTSTLSGRANTNSLKIVSSCFSFIMSERIKHLSGQLQSGFVGFLRGSGDSIRLTTLTGRSQRVDSDYPCSGVSNHGLQGRDRFKIEALTDNIIISQIIDQTSPHHAPITFKLGKYHLVDPTTLPLRLVIRTVLFGGNERVLELELGI